MSDIPGSSPESTPAPAPKPKLILTPKAPSPAPAPEAAALEAPAPAVASPALQAGLGNSSSTPPGLRAAQASTAPRPALKLQGPGTAKIETVNAPAFKSPMPVAADDKPSLAITALSFIAAAAALAFAFLLFQKNQ